MGGGFRDDACLGSRAQGLGIRVSGVGLLDSGLVLLGMRVLGFCLSRLISSTV